MNINQGEPMNDMTAAKVSLELVPLEQRSAAEIFRDRATLADVLAKIKAATNEVPDADTAEGRARIKSLAYKVSRSKVALDEAGKDLVAGIKAQAATIDELRRTAREELDTLRDNVRAPLDAWEAEQTRIEQVAIEQARREREAEEARKAAEEQARREELERREAELRAREEALARAEREAREREEAAAQAERDRIAAEQAERERQEREARIAQEAREQAERDAAERVRKAEQDAADARQREQEAAERAEREQAEAVRVAEERAQQEAAQRERDRQAAAQAELDAAAARAAKTRHRNRITREAIASLVIACPGLDERGAAEVVGAIANGNVDHLEVRW